MEAAMANIGIRLADGKFYAILEEGTAARKRLIVTTVKDDQPSVQIDVYSSTGGVSADAYVGSLIIENIPPRPSGEPDIRLELGLDEQGNLNAFAREEATGEHQTLEVSLKALSEEDTYDIPDFDLQEDAGMDLSTDEFPEEPPFDTSIPEATDQSTDMPDFGEPATSEPEPRAKRSPLLIGILAAAGTVLILLVAFFIYTCTVNRPAEPPAAQTSAPVTTPAPAPAPEPAPAPAPAPEPAKVETPAPEPAKPVAAAPKPAPAKKAGTWYKIRWGDTLWDLSIAYYRTPWLYGAIARANKIRNPDLIISGHWIYIPPR
jgi:hypothetical protein